MDLAPQLQQLSERIPRQLPHVTTEEATKNSLVLPFISALGYNVFDATEVTPELTADVGVKKGEKVDYAIQRDGKPIMLFECKVAGTDLDKAHTSQLYRYFSVTDARFAVLTNGVLYRFYTDLEERNRMDSKPFLEVDLLDLSDAVLRELGKFHADSFDQERILETASDLKFTRQIKHVLSGELTAPSEDLVRHFASQVYSGRLTQSVLEQFTKLTKQALREFISERVSDRLKSALATESKTSAAEAEKEAEPEDKTETTEEEWQGYYIVKAIVSKVVSASRVAIRDQKSYCSVLLDDNNRKPICRLWFNSAQKYLGTFDAEKNETRNAVDTVEDIYSFGDELRETALRYDAAEGDSE